MLTDEERLVLIENGYWDMVFRYVDARKNTARNSGDVAEADAIPETLATALLARQRLERRLGKLASYAAHQATCTSVLNVTDYCSCGLHAALRDGQDANG